MKYIEKETKTVLNIHKYINPWLWVKYSLSAYQGCEFNCIYCYARENKYSKSFADRGTIYVKKDIAEKLDGRIRRSKVLLPNIVGMSGVCDPYQSCEDEYNLTRNCLEVFQKHKWPVLINTKSTLVVRDTGLLSSIASDTWANVAFSISSIDEKKSRFLEPGAPSPGERLKALGEIKRKSPKIIAGVTAIPMVPGIEDADGDIEELIRSASEAKADYFIFSPAVTLESRQALYFLPRLFKKYPELVFRYEDLYQFQYSDNEYKGKYGPKKSYITRQSKKIFVLLEKYNLSPRMPRYIPEDYRKLNYIIAEKLCNRAYLLQATGKAWTTIYWAGMNIQQLEESIVDIAKRNELRKIRNVDGEIEKIIRKEIES